MDRIAASRTYLGDQYHDGAPLEYLQRAGDNRWMHPVTARKLRFILTMLRDKGEEKTFRFIREVVLQELFAEQYSLEFVEEVETRTRTETRTDPSTGETYEVEVTDDMEQ